MRRVAGSAIWLLVGLAVSSIWLFLAGTGATNPVATAESISGAPGQAGAPSLQDVPDFPTVPPMPTVPPLPTVPMLPTVAPLPTVPMLPTVSVPPPVPLLPEPPTNLVDLAPQAEGATRVELGPSLPPGTACLANAQIRALGPFTGYAFEIAALTDGDECVVPAGLVLHSLDGRQDELVMATVLVPADAGGAATVQVYSNCLDVSLHGPYPGAPYVVAGVVAPGSALSRLVSALPDVPSNQVTLVGLQAAVWAITNDIAPERLNAVLRATPEDLGSARRLLELAGVDPAGRALFRGR